MPPRSITPPTDTYLDNRTLEAKALKRYKAASDAEQFEIVKENLAEINFYLSREAITLAKAGNKAELNKLVQLCTALGISYDKLYAKRDTGVKQLSFPAPLLGMVRKGLLLAKGAEGTEVVPTPAREAAPVEVVTPAVEPTPTTPQPRKRYKSAVFQQAHERLCPGVSPTLPPLRTNPEATRRSDEGDTRHQGIPLGG